MNIIEALKVAETPQRRAFYEAAIRICGNKPNIADFDALHENYAAMVESERGESEGR